MTAKNPDYTSISEGIIEASAIITPVALLTFGFIGLMTAIKENEPNLAAASVGMIALSPLSPLAILGPDRTPEIMERLPKSSKLHTLLTKFFDPKE